MIEDGPIIYTRVNSINKGKFFDWGGSYYIYEGHSINKGKFFDWGGSYYIYKCHSINKGNFSIEEGPIIYIRVIQ